MVLDDCLLNWQPIHAEGIVCSKFFNAPLSIALEQAGMVSRDSRIGNDDIVAPVAPNTGNWLLDFNAGPSVRTGK
jgi:hypothetical protein